MLIKIISGVSVVGIATVGFVCSRIFKPSKNIYNGSVDENYSNHTEEEEREGEEGGEELDDYEVVEFECTTSYDHIAEQQCISEVLIEEKIEESLRNEYFDEEEIQRRIYELENDICQTDVEIERNDINRTNRLHNQHKVHEFKLQTYQKTTLELHQTVKKTKQTDICIQLLSTVVCSAYDVIKHAQKMTCAYYQNEHEYVEIHMRELTSNLRTLIQHDVPYFESKSSLSTTLSDINRTILISYSDEIKRQSQILADHKFVCLIPDKESNNHKNIEDFEKCLNSFVNLLNSSPDILSTV